MKEFVKQWMEDQDFVANKHGEYIYEAQGQRINLGVYFGEILIAAKGIEVFSTAVSEPGNNTKPLLGVVYLVNRIDTGEYGFRTIEMAFNTKDKAEVHKKLLDEKYKDDMSFQYRHFYFELEELSVLN